MILQHHHSEVQGYICPIEGNFVVPGHFLDRHDGKCYDGAPLDEHRPAISVVSIYVQTDG